MKLGYDSEAEFVKLIRHWFEACDKRGLKVTVRLRYLQELYEHLIAKIQIAKYPPVHTHVQGIPIKTFKALLHCISSRFSLFLLAEQSCYNTRAVSTLAVESFFSDLTKYEFSGLGAPKSVDIPKLISHVVQINTTKHNPECGFEFITSTREKYPTYFKETDNSQLLSYIFKNHPFDASNNYGKRRPHKLVNVSRPKQIAKGGKGIRQFYTIDETKLTHEQCFGKMITEEEYLM